MQSKNPTRSRDREVKAIRLALWHKEDLPLAILPDTGSSRGRPRRFPLNEGGDTLLQLNAAIIQFSSPHLLQTVPLSKLIVR
jgi:hypothetical protein